MASQRYPSAGRNETGVERLDRHWNDLLQELRVAQTGVQLLTGLLLTLPFRPWLWRWWTNRRDGVS